MLRTSKYYNQDWPDYYCNECGALYQFYVDGKCAKCRPIKKLPERVKVERPLPPPKPEPKQKKEPNTRKKL